MAGNGATFPVLQDVAYSAAGCGSSLGRSNAIECSENHHFPHEMGEALGQMVIEVLNKPPPPAPDDDAGAIMTLARRRRR